MNTLQEPRTARSLAEEHERLRDMALRIGRALDGETEGSLELLRSFVARMDEHLKSEEESWATPASDRTDWTARFMDWSPRSQTERIRCEHEHLIRRLDDVRAWLETAAGRGTELPPGLVSRLRSLLEEILGFELTEARLFQLSLLEGMIEAG